MGGSTSGSNSSKREVLLFGFVGHQSECVTICHACEAERADGEDTFGSRVGAPLPGAAEPRGNEGTWQIEMAQYFQVAEWYKGRMVLGGSGKVSFGRRIRAGP